MATEIKEIKSKEAQSSKKKLVTAGIAVSGGLLLILWVILATLPQKKAGQESFTGSSSIFYQSYKLSSYGNMQVMVKNLKMSDMKDVRLVVENACSSASSNIDAGGKLMLDCLVSPGSRGEQYSHSISLNYTDKGDGLRRKISGTIKTIYS